MSWLLLVLSGCKTLQASQGVTLAWQASSDPTVVGNRVHYGTTSGAYSTTVDVGNVTTATLSGLTPGDTYYYVVTAYNSLGNSSLPSNEVSGVVLGNVIVSLATPNQRVNFNGPAIINLSATASEVGGSIARVDFYSGTTLIAETTVAPYTTQWMALPGRYLLSVVAYDAGGVAGQSPAVPISVTRPCIRSVQRMSDGSNQLTLISAPGGTDMISVSGDLLNWRLMTTLVSTSGTDVLFDPQAINSNQRFYRMSAD